MAPAAGIIPEKAAMRRQVLGQEKTFFLAPSSYSNSQSMIDGR
jgi:hypothetical protein